MAKRRAVSDAPSLEELVHACIVLDDWLHWMPAVCGMSEESKAVHEDQTYLSTYRILDRLMQNLEELR